MNVAAAMVLEFVVRWRIFINGSEGKMENQQSEFWQSVRNLKKSTTDKKIAGVCGGFGEHTPAPAWIWRALFLVLVFVWGIGLAAYIVLWICMPAADEARNA